MKKAMYNSNITQDTGKHNINMMMIKTNIGMSFVDESGRFLFFLHIGFTQDETDWVYTSQVPQLASKSVQLEK